MKAPGRLTRPTDVSAGQAGETPTPGSPCAGCPAPRNPGVDSVLSAADRSAVHRSEPVTTAGNPRPGLRFPGSLVDSRVAPGRSPSSVTGTVLVRDPEAPQGFSRTISDASGGPQTAHSTVHRLWAVVPGCRPVVHGPVHRRPYGLDRSIHDADTPCSRMVLLVQTEVDVHDHGWGEVAGPRATSTTALSLSSPIPRASSSSSRASAARPKGTSAPSAAASRTP